MMKHQGNGSIYMNINRAVIDVHIINKNEWYRTRSKELLRPSTEGGFQKQMQGN